MLSNVQIVLSYSTITSALLLLSLVALLLIKNHKSQVNVSFSFVCLSASLWLFSYSMAYFSNSEVLSVNWFKLGFVGVMFIAVTYFHFTTTFLQIKSTKWLVKLCYCIGFFLVVILFLTNYLIKDLHKYEWGIYPSAGFLHPYFLVFFFGFVNAASCQIGYALFFNKNYVQSVIKKEQLKYILTAFVIFTFASIDFIPNYGIGFYPLGFIPASLFLFVIFYSIVKYRLMDISVVITRTGIFVAVYSIVLGIPFALAFGWQENLIGLLGVNWWIVPLICSTILATVGPFIYLYIQKRTEDKLFQEQRRYQTTLRQASYGMGRIKDLRRLVNLIVHIVNRTVGLEHSVVYIYDAKSKKYCMGANRSRAVRYHPKDSFDTTASIVQQLSKTKEPILYDEIKQKTQDFGDHNLAKLEREMDESKAALIVPSFIDANLIAFIVLGDKTSKKSFVEDDLSVFSILANQAALAIENAQFYEDMKKTHAQLLRAEKMATIGTMADGLSHQINNRLHALGFIAGDALDSIKLKQEVQMSEDLKELMIDLEHALARIQDNVEQGGEIVQGLLKYTRKGEEGFSPVDLDKLLDAAMEMTQFKIRQGELTILREFGGDVPKIKGNFTQLQEVTFNIIDNAYDAMMQRKSELKEEGYQPTLKIAAQNGNGKIFIEFTDNGIGIKEDDKEKLFTPFFTTKLSSKKGTGLGLYVIQRIIEENHGGKVSYESKYKQGTKTKVELKTF